MDLSEIKLYVDGPTETKSLESKFKKECNSCCPDMGYGPGNGLNFTPQAYAKNISPSIIVDLSNRYKSIIIIPDLEKRQAKFKISCTVFAQELKDAVINELLAKTNGKYSKVFLEKYISVCPSDIMFENWIVCDVEGIKKSQFIKDTAKQGNFEGKNGTHILKGMMVKEYKKTVHAKDLFKKVDITRGMSNSHSFAEFVQTIRNLRAIP